jgi:hypothetical protein
VVLLLCACVIGGVWWHGTRSHDFLTPPPESKLAAIHAKAGSSPPPADQPVEVASPPETAMEPALAITLHAGTGNGTASLLVPVLLEVARELEKASDGTLHVTASVAGGRDIPSGLGPPPVAIWLSGAADGSPSTGVLTTTVRSPDALHQDVMVAVIKLIRGYLKHETPVEIPGSPVPRAAWLELGARLNRPPE